MCLFVVFILGAGRAKWKHSLKNNYLQYDAERERDKERERERLSDTLLPLRKFSKNPPTLSLSDPKTSSFYQM